MEWLDGEDLASRLVRGALSVDDALSIGSRISTALGHAHALGIVHRDVKPSNVFLPDGCANRATLVDFGIARLLAPGYAKTQTGLVLGTIGYMAPEQARGDEDLDARVDVFSLGCVLYECLAGRPAFDGQHAVAVLAKILLEDPPRLERDLKPWLADLVFEMLAKDPRSRPHDGAAVSAVLKASGATPSLRPVAPLLASLSVGEQSLACVILVGGMTDVSAVAPTVSSDAQRRNVDVDRALVTPFGGQLEVLADGSMVVLLRARGGATDRARSAARCALALQDHHVGSAVSLTTGRAVLGNDVPVGEAIDRAATLLRAWHANADTRGIVIDDTTAGLLDASFEVRSYEDRLVLVSERPTLDVARTLLGKVTACVGRERDLAHIGGVFDECVAEPGARVMLVTAPAGAGKSRVRFEFTRKIEASDSRVEVFIGRGDAMNAAAPFTILGGALRNNAGLSDGEPADVKRRKLWARVSRNVAETDVTRVAELLGEMVGVHAIEPQSAELREARLDPGRMHHELARALATFIHAEATAGPVIFVIEDLHWAHATTVDLIDQCLDACREQPLFVLAFARPEVRATHPELWKNRATTELVLAPLGRKPCEKVVRDVLGADTPADVLDDLTTRAAGNPLYLEELIRARADGRYGAPGSLLAIIQSWLEELGPDARRMLRAASVFGEIFWNGAAAKLFGGEQSIADRVLADLVEREVLSRRASDRFVDQAEFVFRHDLVREASYLALTPADLKLGHGLAAEWLADASEVQPLVIAEHLVRCGDIDRIIAWLQRWDIDVHLVRVAPMILEVAERLLPFVDAKGTTIERAVARARLATIACSTHRFEIGFAWIEEADALNEPSTASLVRLSRAVLHARVGDFALSTAALSTVDATALQPLDVQRFELSWAQALAANGQQTEALTYLERARRRVASSDMRKLVEIEKLATLVAFFDRKYGLAAEMGERHVELARKAGFAYEVAVGTHNRVDILMHLERLEEAKHALDESLDVTRRHGFMRLLSHNLGLHAYLHAGNNVEAAATQMRSLIAEARSHGYVWDVVSIRFWLAKLLVRAHSPDAAEELRQFIEEANRANHHLHVDEAQELLEALDH